MNTETGEHKFMNQITQTVPRELKFQIIGDSILQIVLQPKQDIRLPSRNVLRYCSLNISIALEFRLQIQGRMGSKMQFRIYNDSNMLGYVGLSMGEGKVMVLDSQIYQDLYVKKEKILAHNVAGNFLRMSIEGLELVCAVKQEEIQENIDEYVFIASEGTILDKELDSSEEIVVEASRLLAISATIRKAFNQDSARFILIKGPGRVLYEKPDSVESCALTVGSIQRRLRKAIFNRVFPVYLSMLLGFGMAMRALDL